MLFTCNLVTDSVAVMFSVDVFNVGVVVGVDLQQGATTKFVAYSNPSRPAMVGPSILQTKLILQWFVFIETTRQSTAMSAYP